MDEVGATKAKQEPVTGIKSRTIIGLSLAIIILIGMYFIPGTAVLTTAGIRTIGIILAFLILMVSEALPITIISLAMVAIMPIVGAAPDVASSFSGYSNSVLFFVVASFGIAAGFTAVPLSRRMLVYLLKMFGKSVNSMLFAIMLATAALSSIVSNVPCTAIFMAVGLSFLELYTDSEAKKRTGKALMIGIPVASMLGGMITPAGSSINLLAIGMLEQITKGASHITFLQWMAIGAPLGLLSIPFAWLFAVKVYKPAPIDQEKVKSFITSLEIDKKMSSKEIKMLVITGGMLILWILSSWVSVINVTIVTMLGCCLMFMPGIRILDWKTFAKRLNMDIFFLTGAVLTMGNLMVSNGVSKWVVTLFPTGPMSVAILVAFTTIVTFILLILFPASLSVVAFMAPPLIGLVSGMGFNPAFIILTLGIAASNSFCLPFGATSLITYGTGYYKMLDMGKSTIPLQIVFTIIATIWIPLCARWVGIV